MATASIAELVGGSLGTLIVGGVQELAFLGEGCLGDLAPPALVATGIPGMPAVATGLEQVLDLERGAEGSHHHDLLRHPVQQVGKGLTSSSPSAVAAAYGGKEGDSYGAQARH